MYVRIHIRMLIGFLQKKAESFLTSWKRHWFVLNDGCLYYFTQRTDDSPRCIIPLDGTRISRGDTELEFYITSTTGDLVKSSKVLEDGSMSLGRHKHFLLRAESAEDRESWVKFLQEESLKFKPLHEIFLRKKEADPSQLTDEPQTALTIPPPLAQGWIRKRIGENSSWKRRYFVLFPDFDNGGITLFYYINQQIAQKMIDVGVQTQQGYIRLRHVRGIYLREDPGMECMELETPDRVWLLCPDEVDHIEYWTQALQTACR